MTAPPIAVYALFSDGRSARWCLRAARSDRLCFPRFDSPSVCAATLGDDAGHCSIRPAGSVTAARWHVDSTISLQTRFETPAA